LLSATAPGKSQPPLFITTPSKKSRAFALCATSDEATANPGRRGFLPGAPSGLNNQSGGSQQTVLQRAELLSAETISP
jgi:hypothetical protein